MPDFPAISFSISAVTLYAYGVALALGSIIAFITLHRDEKPMAIKAGSAPLMMLAGFPPGLVSARLVYCLILRERLFFDPMDGAYLGLMPFFSLQEGGYSLFGLLFGWLLAGLLFAKASRQETGTMMDWLALPTALFIAIARFGEILGGQGYGMEVTAKALQFFPIAVQNSYGEWYLAVFVQEGLAAALIALGILRKRKTPLHPGSKMLSVLIPFASLQIFFESLRQDAYLRLESNAFIRLSQVMALLLLIAALSMLTRRALRTGRQWLMLPAWLSLPFAAACAVAAEFNEKLPLPKALLYGLSLSALLLHIFLSLRALSRLSDDRVKS